MAVHIRNYRSCFVLLGGSGSMLSLCRQLVSSGTSHVGVWAGENSSYEDERISQKMTPVGLIVEDEHRPLGSFVRVLVENEQALKGQFYLTAELENSDFIRGQVPMTKAEVRRFSLERFCIDDGAVCCDIGIGTGSVAVEMGMEIRCRDDTGEVYAIERSGEALQPIQSNAQKFHGAWQGSYIVEGETPGAVEELPVSTHAFTGGSGGRTREIVETLSEISPETRIVASAIILETVGEVLDCTREFGFRETELVQVRATPVESVGRYHMPKAQNPVYVAIMQYPADAEEPVGGGDRIQWQEL